MRYTVPRYYEIMCFFFLDALTTTTTLNHFNFFCRDNCLCLSHQYHSFVDLLYIVIVHKRTTILGAILPDVATCADESLATIHTGNPV